MLKLKNKRFYMRLKMKKGQSSSSKMSFLKVFSIVILAV